MQQANVVLFNLLIAMMGETYGNNIAQRGLQEARLQKTRFVHECLLRSYMWHRT